MSLEAFHLHSATQSESIRQGKPQIIQAPLRLQRPLPGTFLDTET